MKCPKCQLDNREGAKFCKECGGKLELSCPECGASISSPSKFCDECGYDLSKATKATKVDYDQPQTYTPKHLAEKILTVRSAIEGERKIVTVLFADVANFTSMSEKLDPEEVHRIMDGCFKILMGEIHRYEGTINQFTGDGGHFLEHLYLMRITRRGPVMLHYLFKRLWVITGRRSEKTQM